jgi:protocatechuate 3,4-dioxygenase beta subunit
VLGAGEPVAAGTKGLRLTAAKGQTICGVVVDEDGKPVDNAWVHAVDPKDEGRGSRNAQSRADGTFEIAGLEKGRTYSVRASARYRVGAKSDDVEVGATGLKLVLSKGLTSTGRLLDSGGAPLANAQISFSPNEAKDGFGTQVVRTDDDGKFVVSGLVAGPYKASSWIPTSEGAQAWKACGTFKAGDANVELRMP